MLENQYRQGQKKTISCMQNKQEQGVYQQISEKSAPKSSNCEVFEKGTKKKHVHMTLQINKGKTKASA